MTYVHTQQVHHVVDHDIYKFRARLQQRQGHGFVNSTLKWNNIESIKTRGACKLVSRILTIMRVFMKHFIPCKEVGHHQNGCLDVTWHNESCNFPFRNSI